MKNAFQLIREISDTLDMTGKSDCVIRANVTRGYLMREFKPKERGGVLFFRDHPIITPPLATWRIERWAA